MIETPSTIIIGDTVKFTVSLSEYPAPEWVLHYKIGFTTSVDTASVASGSDHSITIAASTTAAWAEGEYNTQLYVTNGTEIYTVSTSRVILKDINSKSHARKVLEAINARLENRATQEQIEYEVNGRRIKFITHDELIRLRTFYLREASNEEARDRIASGLGSGRKVMVRF